MKTETKVLGGVIIATIILLLGGIFMLNQSQPPVIQNTDGQTTYEIDYSKGQKIGSDSAKLRLVEFSDLQCPACLAFEPAVKSSLTKYKDNVQFIYRHFPLPQHIHAMEAANLAEEAAVAGKFWQMHDKLFETQAEWEKLPNVTDYFVNLGKEMGLDEAKVREAITTNKYGAKIEADRADGNKLLVNSTPTFYLNGQKLNLKDFSDLEKVMQSELDKK